MRQSRVSVGKKRKRVSVNNVETDSELESEYSSNLNFPQIQGNDHLRPRAKGVIENPSKRSLKSFSTKPHMFNYYKFEQFMKRDQLSSVEKT